MQHIGIHIYDWKFRPPVEIKWIITLELLLHTCVSVCPRWPFLLLISSDPDHCFYLSFFNYPSVCQTLSFSLTFSHSHTHTQRERDIGVSKKNFWSQHYFWNPTFHSQIVKHWRCFQTAIQKKKFAMVLVCSWAHLTKSTNQKKIRISLLKNVINLMMVYKCSDTLTSVHSY